ncbi:MAG: hypothetical protein IJ910_09420 [Bacteroidaceae bacterium]|nr:hypothetical protein [Bacteroidaceae bacterium]
MKNKKEINKKAYFILFVSALIASAIIVVVGIACYFSGYKLSATAHFWLWVIILVSAAAMTLSLIRTILDILPIRYKRGDKQPIAIESDKVLSTTTKADMESQQEDSIETQEDAIETQEDAIETHEDTIIETQEDTIETEFHHKFVTDKFMKRPIYKTLKSMIDKEPGGKNAVLILICAKEKKWIISIPKYKQALKYFGENIGSVSNYSIQKKNYKDNNLDHDIQREKDEMKELMDKYLDEMESK